MVYGIWCIMPSDRVVFVDAHELVRPVDEGCRQRLEQLSLDEVGRICRFHFWPSLIFTHEKLLREALHSKFTLDEAADEFPGLSTPELREKLRRGFIHSDLAIRYVGVIDGKDVGYGLFAHSRLESGAFLGEYAGVVGSHSAQDSAYCCQYASCGGDMHVNALEYGNVIRFINHSSSPNAALRVTQVDGLPHVLCFLTRALEAGEQIFINYGAAYWQRHAGGGVQIC